MELRNWIKGLKESWPKTDEWLNKIKELKENGLRETLLGTEEWESWLRTEECNW